MNNPEEILDKYRKIAWKSIERYLNIPRFPIQFRIPKSKSVEKQFHLDLISDYPNRMGKYLRPTLLLLTCKAMTSNIKLAINTAAAMQLSEDWLLIHDDIEDGSEYRRGKPTLHNVYNQELAINAGDSLQIIMWKILLDNRNVLDIETTNSIMDEFYTMLTRTVIGQTTEIDLFKKRLINYSDDDWFFIADGKTSYYTIAGPMRLGAIIAGATKKQIDLITTFGMYLGRCFQIIDDVLDVTSNFSGQKKQIGNDIYEGKRTLILSHLLNSLDKKDKIKLIKIYSKTKKDKTKAEVDWILNKMKENKSISYAKSIATKYKEKALKMLMKDLSFLDNNSARNEIETLVHFILNRNH